MSNIDKRALRDELSNPAIGSNTHLRALALLDELKPKMADCRFEKRSTLHCSAGIDVHAAAGKESEMREIGLKSQRRGQRQ
jgi:hypothetical protein